MKKDDTLTIRVHTPTKKQFDKIRHFNGWTADFFLKKLLEEWKDGN